MAVEEGKQIDSNDEQEQRTKEMDSGRSREVG